MNLKKRLKKEKTNKTRAILICSTVMILMPYMVLVLNDQGIFKGWEYNFSLSYAILIDVLLFLYILKSISDLYLSFYVGHQKIKIKDGLFKLYFQIQLQKVVYVDIIKRKNDEFEIFIIMKKGKRNRKYIPFNIEYVKIHPEFRLTYEYLSEKNTVVDFSGTYIRKGGVKKYYLLYMLFKNSHNSEYSKAALEYVKRFMEEYNMS